MRKKVFGKQLGRARKSRKGLFRSLVRSLVEHGSIKTTKAKSKAVLSLMEKLVTLAKKEDLAAKRNVLSMLGNDKQTMNKLFEMYKGDKRKSGFVNLTELPLRLGDNAQMVKMNLIVEKNETTPRVEKDKNE